jgi:hypothetical protein
VTTAYDLMGNWSFWEESAQYLIFGSDTCSDFRVIAGCSHLLSVVRTSIENLGLFG